jgi:CheY-like chemotaxis protein
VLPPKIAVIHNDDAVSNLLVTFLEDEGYLPIAYADRDATLTELRLSPPDLLIIELDFPATKRETTLVDELRFDPRTRHIPVIVLTTMANPEEVRPESCTHNCEMLSEPFDLNSIQGLIRSLLKNPHHLPCG